MRLRAMNAAARREAAETATGAHPDPFAAQCSGLHAAPAAGQRCWTHHTFFEEYLHHYAPFLPAAALRGLARRVSRAQCNAVDAVVVPSTAMRATALPAMA